MSPSVSEGGGGGHCGIFSEARDNKEEKWRSEPKQNQVSFKNGRNLDLFVSNDRHARVKEELGHIVEPLVRLNAKTQVSVAFEVKKGIGA